ncbi:MAG: proton-conducting transporter membrane subunit [Burkholderiales bacterium]
MTLMANTTTAGGLLLALAVLVPFTGVLLALVAGGRNAQRIALVTLVANAALAARIAWMFVDAGAPLVYVLGGYAPPLGVALRADAMAVAMLAAVAVVVLGIATYASADFRVPDDAAKARAPLTYWLLALAVTGSLNLVFVSGDLFTLYVALELLTFAGVPLVCLDGRGETLRAALRYLLFALAGSLLYLLGAVLLYGAYGTLDIPSLAAALRFDPATVAAAALMTTGLLAKTALFPLHLWLPPAHAGAPAAASAILSALVIKGSWFLVLRLWFDVFPALVTPAAAQLVAGLGATVIVVASVVALRQERLKLLVAYSTLAQIGYLFLLFPLAFEGGALVHGPVLAGGVLQAIAHATAKAAMFMAAGLVYAALGHDRIRDLAGVGRALPLTVLAFVVAGLALMGVLPSGAYLAKKLLLASADASGQWWWTAVLTCGAAFTAGYVALFLFNALRRGAPVVLAAPVALRSQLAALALAVGSFLLAFAAQGPLPDGLVSSPLKASELGNTLAVCAAGVLLALAAARDPRAASNAAVRAVRRVGVPAGNALARLDFTLRRWPVATLAMLALAAGFAGALTAR